MSARPAGATFTGSRPHATSCAMPPTLSYAIASSRMASASTHINFTGPPDSGCFSPFGLKPQ